METTPGRLLREARERRGLSQKRLAIRAGTTQSAISRIESDKVSPTIETVSELLHLLGEELVLGARAPDSGIDRPMIRERWKLAPAERLEYGRAFAEQLIRMSPNVRSEQGAT